MTCTASQHTGTVQTHTGFTPAVEELPCLCLSQSLEARVGGLGTYHNWFYSCPIFFFFYFSQILIKSDETQAQTECCSFYVDVRCLWGSSLFAAPRVEPFECLALYYYIESKRSIRLTKYQIMFPRLKFLSQGKPWEKTADRVKEKWLQQPGRFALPLKTSWFFLSNHLIAAETAKKKKKRYMC